MSILAIKEWNYNSSSRFIFIYFLWGVMSEFKKILIVFGTRPEAIKMAPLVRALKNAACFHVYVCVTAQHRHLLDQVLDFFDLIPDYDLNLMRFNQGLANVTADVLLAVSGVIDVLEPDLVVVHGDTTTSFASALAAFYRKIAVAHVEAGLRTGDFYSPWPEEMNRFFTGRLASFHFAPTQMAKENLLREGVHPERVWVTGNTVVDALSQAVEKLGVSTGHDTNLDLSSNIWKDRKMILVTGHRRENFGDGIEGVCRALRRIALEFDVSVVYPVHPNPNVMKPVYGLLSDAPNIHLIEPLDYISFVALMSHAYFILTDSGGVQEEAPSLGKPVLVMRENTERPEAVAAGTVLMVGVDEQRIYAEAARLLTDSRHYDRMSAAHNPYGDGKAAERIVAILEGKEGVHEFQ